nr:MAG TPA: hypothetical protein [Caudoviricetes sp.]
MENILPGRRHRQREESGSVHERIAYGPQVHVAGRKR